MNSSNTPLRVVVLISGSGSNLQAIMDDIGAHSVAAEVVAVISNRPDAFGLERARNREIATEVIENRQFESREAFDAELQTRIDSYQPDLLVLAGFMRILSDGFVDHYTGRMINIHPSLLPKYQGLNTHQRALDAGDQEHGASVHFVTPELDGGPVILQGTVPVMPGDTVETLTQRVHQLEHKIYPQVVRWFAAKRLKLDDHTVLLDGQPMTEEQKYYNE